VVCYCESFRGIKCFEKHFTCEDCLKYDVETNGSERITINGDVKCLFLECPHFLPKQEVVKFMPMDTIMKQVILQKEKEISYRIENETTKEFILQRYYDYIINKILSLSCPECGQAYIDFNGCCALKCSRCKCNFCAWCLEASPTTSRNHTHVMNCRVAISYGNTGYFGKNESVAKAEKKLKTQKLQVFWDTLDKGARRDLLDRVNILLPGVVDIRLTA